MAAKLGFVYFIRSGDFVKIGFATDLPTRLSGIKTSNPNDVELLAKCHGTLETEARFHERFKRHHYRGEWFRYDDEIRSAVQSLGVYQRPKNRVEIAPLLEDPYEASIRRAMESRRR